LQFSVKRRHFLLDDFFPTFRELSGLSPDIIDRCFYAIGWDSVDALNFLE
jgi:hypothetical protein